MSRLIGLAPVLGVAGLVFLLLMGCATPVVGLDAQALRGRAEKEEAALLKRVRVYDDRALSEYLGLVARRLLAETPGASADAGASAGAGARITVLEDPTLGAFAMPGRHVYVHTGLLSFVETEAELAVILARELAHDPSRLAVRAWKGPMPAVALGPTAAAVLGLDLQLVAGAAIEGYGRGAERAADADALRRLSAAGYDGAGAARVFERLAREDADRGALGELLVYGNRRRMGERDEAMRELLGAARPAPGPVHDGGVVSGEEFRRRMRPVVRDNAALDIRAGRFALAQRQLDRVLALGPDDPIAELAYGDLHRLQSQRASGETRTESARQALARYDRAVELDPTYAEPFRQLALLHYQRRDLAKARAALERYLALKGNAPDAQRMREYLAVLPN